MSAPIKASDHDALNLAFAEKVAGWRFFKETRGDCTLCINLAPDEKEPWNHWSEKERDIRRARYDGPISGIEAQRIGFFGRTIPDFTRFADAVLPWLGKCARWKAVQYGQDFVGVDLDAPRFGEGEAATFPHAAVIALLRAHGVEVVE